MQQSQLSTSLLVVADRVAAREELAAGLATVTSTRVTAAVSVREAISELDAPERRVDLVVIDLELSGSGAVTLTRKIRDVRALGPRNMAILLVGGIVATPIYQAAARLGIQGHLPRPFTNEGLRLALRAALIARPTQPVAPRVSTPVVRRDVKAAVPAKPVPYEQPVVAVPVANKPFRYGLQTAARVVKPLSDDDGFGLEPVAPAPRPRLLRALAETMPVLVRPRRAVA